MNNLRKLAAAIILLTGLLMTLPLSVDAVKTVGEPGAIPAQANWAYPEVPIDGASSEYGYYYGVTVLNTAPTDIQLSNHTINDNASPGTLIGELSAIDSNEGDSFTYSIVSDEAGSFSINGNKLISATAFNYEEASSYNIVIRATDMEGAWYEKDFTITIVDVTPPSGSFRINGRAEKSPRSEVQLSIFTDFAHATEMRFSNDQVLWSDWEPAAPEKLWTLSEGIGLKAIYMELRDPANNVHSGTSWIERYIPVGGELVYSRQWKDDFYAPGGLAVDGAGDIYIADTNNTRVVKYDKDGQPLLTLTVPGLYGGNVRTNGVSVDALDQVYVVYGGEYKDGIRVFDSNGEHLRDLGGTGAGNGELNAPQSAAIDAMGNVYVSDTGNHRVQKFDANGDFILAWGGYGSDEGRFNAPHGIALSQEGDVFVADRDNNRVQKFSADGEFIASFGTLYGPRGLAFDQNNLLYVADTLHHRVLSFTADGDYVGMLGRSEPIQSSGWGEFNRPSDLAVSSAGELYVLESNGLRVQVFSPVPTGADLTELTVSPGTMTVPFSPTTEVIKAKLHYSDTSFTITPTAREADAAIEVNGQAVGSGVAWEYTDMDFGTAVIEVLVTSADGQDSRKYTVEVTRPLSDNAWLQALNPSAGEWNFEEGIHRGTIAYTLRIPHDVQQITLTPETEDANATVFYGDSLSTERTIVGAGDSIDFSLAYGESKLIYFTVMAQDGMMARYYSIELRRGSSPNNDLDSLIISPDAELDFDFDSQITHYTVNVSHETSALTFTPLAAQAQASVQMTHRYGAHGQDVSPYYEVTEAAPAYAVELEVGLTRVSVLVTAQSGVIKWYFIEVIRAPSDNNLLRSLQLSEQVVLEPAFDKVIEEYNATVGNTITALTIMAEAEEPNARISVNGVEVASGFESEAIPLQAGSNRLEVEVEAQNGALRAYTIWVQRDPSSNAALSDLLLSDEVLLETAFSSEVLSYQITVPNTVSSLMVMPVVQEPNATYAIRLNDTTLVPPADPIPLVVGSNNVIRIIVTAQDGVTESEYQLAVTREASDNAMLSKLTSSGGQWQQPFDKFVQQYRLLVAHETQSLRFTPVVDEPNARVVVRVDANGEIVTLEEASDAISLQLGLQTVVLEVTAQDGAAMQEYSIEVIRKLPGLGTAASPHLIGSAFELDLIRYDLAAHYRLVNDINMAEILWKPAGSEAQWFTGVLDGAGHSIYNLVIDEPEADYVGLFTAIDGTGHEVSVRNLMLSDITVKGNQSVGVLAGEIYSASIASLRLEGVTVEGTGVQVGGMAGMMMNVHVANSYVNGAVSGNMAVGGLVGLAAASVMERSYTSGAVTAELFMAGGLGGSMTMGSRITDSYSVSEVGGFGFVGGLVGSFTEEEVATNAYFISMGEEEGEPLGTALTEMAMREQGSFTDWDFSNVWSMHPGPYPQLRIYLDSNADLADLSLDAGAFTPDFASSVLDYEVSVPFESYQLLFTASLASPRASLIVNGEAAASGAAIAVSLSVGENLNRIQVVAEDGTEKLYNVKVVRGTLNGIKNGQFLNEAIQISFTDGWATLNGELFNSGDTVSEDGEYSLIVTLGGDNVSTFHFILDQTPPTGEVSVHNGVSITNERELILDISWQDANEVQMSFSHDNAIWSEWEPAASAKAWTLSAEEGTKTVFMRLRDEAGNVTSMETGIILDQTAPSGSLMINEGAAFTNDHQVELTISWTDASPVELRFSDDGESWSEWETADLTRAWTLSQEGMNVVYMQLRDIAGNVNLLPLHVSITLDLTRPTGAISINDEAEYTTDINVQLAITAEDGGGSGLASMRLSDDGEVWQAWQTFVPQLDWLLNDEYGVQSVYLQLQDQAGNISSTYQAGIAHVSVPQLRDSSISIGFNAAVQLTEEQFAYSNRDASPLQELTVTSLPEHGVLKLDGQIVEVNQMIPWAKLGALTYTAPSGWTGTTALQWRGGTNRVLSDNNAILTIRILPPQAVVLPNQRAIVIINGEEKRAGQISTSIQGQRSVTVVTIDEQAVNLSQQNDNHAAAIVVPVSGDTDVAIAALNGQMVKNLEREHGSITLRKADMSYTLPAHAIQINAIAEQLGNQIHLSDIKIEIEISEPQAANLQLAANAESAAGFTLIAPPVEFVVRYTYEERTAEITTFTSYVERTLALPEGIKPAQVTTAIVLEENGTIRHVPTKIVERDGRYYAIISSLTNSLYTLVWNEADFKDLNGHWSLNDVVDMASRFVLAGVSEERFAPNREMTRAEFAAVVVRALGLKPGVGSPSFLDVKPASWYAPYVITAAEFEVISGFADGTFRPNDKVTREQAMTMIARAMRMTDLQEERTEEEIAAVLASFIDGQNTSQWARAGIAAVIEAQIVSGRSGFRIAAQESVTRAEVAVMVRRLLLKADLIV